MPTHAEKRVLPYKPKEMFDLVAAIDRYNEFLPWCIGSRIKERRDNVVLADLVIGFKLFREKFTSKVTLDEENMRIDVEYMDGPFRYLNNHWQFNDHPDGCEVDFFVDFEFRSMILQKTIGMLFNEAVTRMITAFEGRARDLYGAPAAPAPRPTNG
ncbi:type II toxin-antitoxin system RatA family toxin [Sneathiella chungangensis]|uniref:Type II toxin-antitoxin system RatA family toxin n=1 Tax=Sneathiella chungangensis TaxID=1418234 RepID=A0A845M999_9PROT|nr:type II toxin-antitoxin system RatA family toxin [Sneathiella chungangensis]MZR20949.1 type II toxin-antitoxin system RatA family toxin [Sneathiella chungangensis]